MSRNQQFLINVVTLVLCVMLLVIAKPLMPVDETRYMSVAWEMWNSGNWLVPFKNGVPYDHKPPLLFWIINLVWSLFGTHTFLDRLIIPIVALTNLLLVRKLTTLLLPSDKYAPTFAPIILMGFSGWFLYSSLTMFDQLIAVFVLGFVICMVKASHTQSRKWTLLAGLCIGLGMLAKGPVMLVYSAPFFLLNGLIEHQSNEKKAPIKRAFSAHLLGIGLVLCWAIPAAIVGGKDYANAIFLGQSVGRMSHAFAHARPVYWYLLILPGLLFPWAFLRSFWRASPFKLNNAVHTFCLSYFATVFIIFSLISGKQVHYLLPVLPFVAIWLSSKIAWEDVGREPMLATLLVALSLVIISSPYWLSSVLPEGITANLNMWFSIPILVLAALNLTNKTLVICRPSMQILSMPIAMTSLILFASPVLFKLYNVELAAKQVAQLQQTGKQVAYVGTYHDTFGYHGKLSTPLVELDEHIENNEAYFSEHNNDYTVAIIKDPSLSMIQHSLFHQPFRSRELIIIKNSEAQQVIASQQLASVSGLQAASISPLNMSDDE